LAWLQDRLPLTTTQTELAAAWGWNDMRVSRQLAKWQEAGLISLEGRRPVTITMPSATVTELTPVTSPDQRSNISALAPLRVSSAVLTVIAFALAGVAITINALYGRSLGATDIAGWLFMAIGIASDAAATVLPRHAVGLWRCRQIMRAGIAWLIWSLTFAFALVASSGFASLNIADTTASRSARSTPAIELAQRTADTIAKSREAECIRRGPQCRALESDERKALADLTTARHGVTEASDPQATKAAELIAWLTPLRPDADDIAKFRLVLLTLLPQLGGLLLMIADRPS